MRGLQLKCASNAFVICLQCPRAKLSRKIEGISKGTNFDFFKCCFEGVLDVWYCMVTSEKIDIVIMYYIKYQKLKYKCKYKK